MVTCWRMISTLILLVVMIVLVACLIILALLFWEPFPQVPLIVQLTLRLMMT